MAQEMFKIIHVVHCLPRFQQEMTCGYFKNLQSGFIVELLCRMIKEPQFREMFSNILSDC